MVMNMKKTFYWRGFAAVAAVVLMVGCSGSGRTGKTGCCGEGFALGEAVPVLHITDLTRPYGDFDDHWDAACQFALAKKGAIDLKGVVMDYIPSIGAPDIEAISQLNWITSKCVPAGMGQMSADAKPGSGLELIRRTLEESSSPVVIHVVGGCLDVVKACELWPELFERKVKAVYLNAGSSIDTPRLEYNVWLHPAEYSAMFALPCPVFWMPCMENVEEWCETGGCGGKYCTYYRFHQAPLYEKMDNDLLAYFSFAHSRQKSSDWMTPLTTPVDMDAIAEYGKQIRNMWCTAGFLHSAGMTVWKDGSIHALGEDTDAEVFRFVPISVTCSSDGRVAWELAEGACSPKGELGCRKGAMESASSCRKGCQRSESPDRLIFEVMDEAAYEPAMTKALAEMMSWM